jgi:hypothetical protein
MFFFHFFHLTLTYWSFVICFAFLFIMLSLYHISSHKLVKLTRVDLVFFNLLFFNFIICHWIIDHWACFIKYYLKKNWHGQCTSQRVMTSMPFRWHMRSLFGYQKLAFVVMLGAACRPLSNNVAHVDRGGLVGPRRSFFLVLSSLSHSLEIQAWPSKK